MGTDINLCEQAISFCKQNVSTPHKYYMLDQMISQIVQDIKKMLTCVEIICANKIPFINMIACVKRQTNNGNKILW